jgi:hypothetical protein
MGSGATELVNPQFPMPTNKSIMNTAEDEVIVTGAFVVYRWLCKHDVSFLICSGQG